MKIQELKKILSNWQLGKVKSIKNRKAQIWSLDVIIGIALFLSAIILFYFYALNFSDDSQQAIAELERDGKFVSSNLLSEGSPKNWNLTTVEAPGIAVKNRINQSKLDLFYQLANSDYNKTKQLLNTRFDFYFFFTDPITVNALTVDGIGKPGLNRTNLTIQEDPKNIVKTTRYIIYNNEPTIMNLYLWEK